MISITKHMAESLGKMFAELYPRQNCLRHKDTKYLREQIKSNSEVRAIIF